MKIIGVEFRAGFRNYVPRGGQCLREIFLHPVEIEFPVEYANRPSYPFASVTVHTSHGDTTTELALPVEAIYKEIDDKTLAVVFEKWESQFRLK